MYLLVNIFSVARRRRYDTPSGFNVTAFALL